MAKVALGPWEVDTNRTGRRGESLSFFSGTQRIREVFWLVVAAIMSFFNLALISVVVAFLFASPFRCPGLSVTSICLLLYKHSVSRTTVLPPTALWLPLPSSTAGLSTTRPQYAMDDGGLDGDKNGDAGIQSEDVLPSCLAILVPPMLLRMGGLVEAPPRK